MPKQTDTAIQNKVSLPEVIPVKLPDHLERIRLLNVEQLAALLGFSVQHTRRLYRAGKLPAPVKINGRKCGWPANVAAKLVGAPEAEAA